MWGPAQFRSATIRDLMDGLAGWREANGGGVANDDVPSPQELHDLKARYG